MLVRIISGIVLPVFLACSFNESKAEPIHNILLRMTAGEYLKHCNSGPSVNDTWCFGYIAGLLDGVALYQIAPSDAALLALVQPICMPNDPTYEERQNALQSYLQTKTEYHDASISIAILLAIRELWPCSEQ